ncbi:MAG: thiol-disulfide oxidoreductase DCC family protein [Planctomycetota bacterium]
MNSPTNSTSTTLPSPAERPTASVVIFDGQCRFCTASVRSLTRFDWLGKLAYRSLHDPQVAVDYPDLSYDQMMREMHLVDQQGRRYGGAAAMRFACLRLPLLVPLGLIMHIPGTMPLWRFLYRTIAERRYRFGRIESCDGGTCSLHHRPRGQQS